LSPRSRADPRRERGRTAMSVIELSVLYALIGVGCAIALIVHAKIAGENPPVLDALVLVFFWPLLGPFRLFGARPNPPDDLGFESLEARVSIASHRLEEIDRVLA